MGISLVAGNLSIAAGGGDAIGFSRWYRRSGGADTPICLRLLFLSVIAYSISFQALVAQSRPIYLCHGKVRLDMECDYQ